MSDRWGIPPKELAKRLSVEEFRTLYALHRIDPRGEDRKDLRAAIVAKTIVDMTPRKPGSPAIELEHFMFDFDRQGSKENVATSEEVIADFATRFSVRVTKK